MNKKILIEQYKEKCDETIKKIKVNHKLMQKLILKMTVEELKECVNELDLELHFLNEEIQSINTNIK